MAEPLQSRAPGSIGLDSEFLYYAADTQVRRVHKIGGPSQLVASDSGIRVIYVYADTQGTTVFWGGWGSIRSHRIGSNLTFTHVDPLDPVNSLAFNGTDILWTDCEQIDSPHLCELHRTRNFVTESLANDLYFSQLEFDATRVFVSGWEGLYKYVF